MYLLKFYGVLRSLKGKKDAEKHWFELVDIVKGCVRDTRRQYEWVDTVYDSKLLKDSLRGIDAQSIFADIFYALGNNSHANLRLKFRCFTIVQNYKIFCYFMCKKGWKTVKWVMFAKINFLLAIFSLFRLKNEKFLMGRQVKTKKNVCGSLGQIKNSKFVEKTAKHRIYSRKLIITDSKFIPVENNRKEKKSRYNDLAYGLKCPRWIRTLTLWGLKRWKHEN